MLVDKSAQYQPKKFLRAWTIHKVFIRRLFFENEINFSLNYFKYEIKIKNSFRNSLKLC